MHRMFLEQCAVKLFTNDGLLFTNLNFCRSSRSSRHDFAYVMKQLTVFHESLGKRATSTRSNSVQLQQQKLDKTESLVSVPFSSPKGCDNSQTRVSSDVKYTYVIRQGSVPRPRYVEMYWTNSTRSHCQLQIVEKSV